VKPKPTGQQGNAKAVAWIYFGSLCDEEGICIDEDRVYCKLCLYLQQAMGDKDHPSKVVSFATNTSTGNLNLHLSQKYDIVANLQEKSTTIIGYLSKYASAGSSGSVSGATSAYKKHRPVVLSRPSAI